MGQRACAARLRVLGIDAFYFGTRKPDLHSVSEDMRRRYSLDTLDGLDPGSREYIQKYNYLCIGFETLFMRHVLMAAPPGRACSSMTTGKASTILLTREEVDADRIGCCGLSLGGIRSVLLAGLDGRIKASVAAGWMIDVRESLLFDRLQGPYLHAVRPELAEYMDIPDVASLSAPMRCSYSSARRTPSTT